MVEELRSILPEILENLFTHLQEVMLQTEPCANEEAVAILLDLNLTKQKYENLWSYIMDKNINLFPAYEQIMNVKKECYPDNIEVTDVTAKVNLQSLLNHTASRFIKINSTNFMNVQKLILYSKWGFNGSSGQREYKQILSGKSNSYLILI